jgi:hypothetical protein
VLGVVGVLLLVHAKYEIDHLKPYLDALRQTAGFYFRRVSLSSGSSTDKGIINSEMVQMIWVCFISVET